MRKPLVFAALLGLTTLPTLAQAPPSAPDGIEAFNQKLEDATRRMDNAATMALWADDGISLLPSVEPIVGKAAIAAFMDRVTGEIKGARMQKLELDCKGIEVRGPCIGVVHRASGRVDAGGQAAFRRPGQDASRLAKGRGWEVAPAAGDVEPGEDGWMKWWLVSLPALHEFASIDADLGRGGSGMEKNGIYTG